MEPDHPAADDDHGGWQHTGNAVKKHAAAASRRFKRASAGLNRHSACHLAHWLEKRQPTVGVRNRLVRYAHRTGPDQVTGLFRIGREVKRGVKNLSLAQHGPLGGLRLFDLDDHLRTVENLSGLDDLTASTRVTLVGRTDATSGIRLDQHRVAMAHQLLNALGRCN